MVSGRRLLRGIKAYRRLGEPMTCARSTVERLIKARGVEHARLVLMLFAETEGNCDQLSGPAIWAVSDVVLKHPKWANAGGALLEAFDGVPLAEICKFAKATKLKRRAVIATMVCIFLDRSALGSLIPVKRKRDPAQPRPPGNKRALNAAAAA
jgi:hypothetical protein